MTTNMLMPKLRTHGFDVALGASALLCVVLMLIASSDPVPQSLQGTWLHSALRQFSTGNQITFDLAAGVVAGVFIYYLVVRVPEWSKRRRLRSNLKLAYELCKQECIAVYLGCFAASYPAELPSQLLDQRRFREFFKEAHTSSQTKWDAVANGMDDRRLKDLIVELEVLLQEVQFTLGAIEVKDLNAFRFFKSMSRVLYRSKIWTTDYDSMKSLLGFLWSFHTGWSWVEGYRETDPIADMIAAI